VPAPSLAALRDFETQLDTVLATVLLPYASAPYGFQVVGHDSSQPLTTPRIEFEISLGDPPGPQGSNLVRADTGAQTAFSGTLALRLVYDQLKIPADTLGAARGSLRSLFSPETQTINATNLPYLDVCSLTEISSARARFRDEESEKLLSEWVTVWAFNLYIRPTAWPV
jgi:hypothetical protein